MRLKFFREKSELTQAKLAEQLNTTSQTVSRWESGKIEMSGQRLLQVSRLLRCTVDDLVGLRTAQFVRYVDGVDSSEVSDHCWGTLTVSWHGNVTEHPISNRERLNVINRADEFEQANGWLKVVTLNNKILLLNFDNLDGVDLIEDAVAAPPTFASKEAYIALGRAEQCKLDEIALTELDAATRGLSETEQSDLTDRVIVRYRSGKSAKIWLEEGVAEAISSFMDELGAAHFVQLPGEGGYETHVVGVRQAAIIEIPSAQFDECANRWLAEHAA
ncbi:MAG: helix-turn-helix transcriptional regulator [Maricaulis sp.]|nr:helix-turn-helix transcriptional regulator [Maricaulis sp.]